MKAWLETRAWEAPTTETHMKRRFAIKRALRRFGIAVVRVSIRVLDFVWGGLFHSEIVRAQGPDSPTQQRHEFDVRDRWKPFH